MEEFLLGRILAADELHVIDHQHVDRAELIFERNHVLEAKRADELVHELLGRKVDHLAARVLGSDVPGDRVHQVRLAEPDIAIKKQRVEGDDERLRGAAFGDTAGGRVREIVGLSDDKILKGEARIERRTDLRSLFAAGAVLGHNLRLRLQVCDRMILQVRDHHHLHHQDRGILGVPERANAVGVVIRNPVPQEFGWHCNAHAPPADIDERYRLDPGSVHRIADFGAQSSADARPLILHFAAERRLIRHRLVAPRNCDG